MRLRRLRELKALKRRRKESQEDIDNLEKTRKPDSHERKRRLENLRLKELLEKRVEISLRQLQKPNNNKKLLTIYFLILLTIEDFLALLLYLVCKIKIGHPIIEPYLNIVPKSFGSF